MIVVLSKLQDPELSEYFDKLIDSVKQAVGIGMGALAVLFIIAVLVIRWVVLFLFAIRGRKDDKINNVT